MKVIRKDKILDKDLIDNIVNEKKTLQNTDHPFLVHMRYGFSTDERLFFVMDFVRGGELYAYLKEVSRVDEKDAKLYIASLASAIGHLHDNNLIHRDIKPENILIDTDGYPILADFGIAKELPEDGDEAQGSFCGTLDYIAIEILRNEK